MTFNLELPYLFTKYLSAFIHKTFMYSIFTHSMVAIAMPNAPLESVASNYLWDFWHLYAYLYWVWLLIFRIISDMRTLSADWMANTSRPELELQSMQREGEESKGLIFYPRAVAPTTAQVFPPRLYCSFSFFSSLPL